MAARNDQTLQIALIVFVGFTVVLGGFLVFVNRLRADARQQVASLEKRQRDDENSARELLNDNDRYKELMGFGKNVNREQVEEQFKQDVDNFMLSFPEADQVYRTVVSRLDAENKRSTEQESQAKQREKELKERLGATEREKDAQIKIYLEELNTVKADAAKERNAFNQARADLEQKRDELGEALERQREKYDTQVSDLSTNVSELEAQLAKVIKSRDKLIDERERESPSFEIADGRIAWVNQANRTVWINLGESDALRRQVTFSVYEQTESDAGKAEKKASIEVIRVLGDNMAEARITDDDARDPILPGDWIYSPLWHRGKQIHFALTGVLDIDGDGRADLQQAKDLISLNGGVVDSAVNEEGGVDGKMTVETRYLVLGDFPSLPSQSDLRNTWETMSRDAKDLGVETITLSEFLNQMGYKPLDRSVVLGDGSRAADFIPRPSKFRPRTPYGGR